MLAFTPNQRGFLVGKFKDRNGEDCSMQESSLATEECIWLGMDRGTHVEGQCLARMHLSREQAGELSHHLRLFAEYGDDCWKQFKKAGS